MTFIIIFQNYFSTLWFCSLMKFRVAPLEWDRYRGFDPRSSQTKDSKIGFAASPLSTQHKGVQVKIDKLAVTLYNTFDLISITPMTFRMSLDLSFNHGNPIKMAAYKIFCRLLIHVSFLLLRYLRFNIFWPMVESWTKTENWNIK